jgi:hypothetical protein
MKIKRTTRERRDGKHRNGHAYDRIVTPPPLPTSIGKAHQPGTRPPAYIIVKTTERRRKNFVRNKSRESFVASVRMRRGRVWDTDDHVKSRGCLEVDRCVTACRTVER